MIRNLILINKIDILCYKLLTIFLTEYNKYLLEENIFTKIT